MEPIKYEVKSTRYQAIIMIIFLPIIFIGYLLSTIYNCFLAGWYFGEAKIKEEEMK